MAKQIDILCSESTLYNAWSIVKAKGAAGGIDGVSIQEFEKEKRKEIPLLAEELENGTWKPYPYLEIEIPKSKDPDQFAISRHLPYIRYADDFLFLCESKEQAQELAEKVEQYLNEKLKLSLNKPISIISLSDKFDFLGITIKNGQAGITEKKREELNQRILALEMDKNGLTLNSEKVWTGISNYYALLLPENDLESFDAYLLMRLQDIVNTHPELFASKTSLQTALAPINFLSRQYQARKKLYIGELVADYAAKKNEEQFVANNEKNRKLIQQRKREFRKIETETSGLLVNKAGTFIGLTNRGVTISEKGKVIAHHHPDNLSQIVVTGQGISMSSNLISFCLNKKIPIDFFDYQGTHLGSIINSRYLQNTLWDKQSKASSALNNSIALGIINGKIKNQFALVKYFNKYHKNHYPNLQAKLSMVEQEAEAFRQWRKKISISDEEFMQKLIGHESQMAIRYWDYIRELISDDDVDFGQREHQGARDLVNSMLNYGYAILYVRVWQALLAAKLNPYDSIIHVRQEGKPTLVYDMVEIFRSQIVDRVVISLIQKGQDLEVRNGLLTDKTRQILVKSVMERLARYEKYQGEEMKMEQIIYRQAKLLAKSFEGTDKFKPYVAKW